MNFRKSAARAVSVRALAAVLLFAGPSLPAQAQAQLQQAPAAGQATGIPAWAIPSADLPADPAVRFGTLENGMRYALMQHETPKGAAAIRFTFDAGVRDEMDGEMGVAHFLEHMAFNGSTNIPEGELIKKLERLGLAFGADSNAVTDGDNTTYMLDLPKTDDTTVSEALGIMREMASNLTIAPAAVDREKGIIQSESRVRNVPGRRRLADFLTVALPANRIGQRISITPEQIAGTDAADLRAFYTGYYRPDNATLVIVGDFDVAAMEQKVRTAFADWRATGSARAPYAPPVAVPPQPLSGFFVDPAIPEIVEFQRLTDYTAPANSVAGLRDELLKIVASLALSNRLAEIARQPDSPILGGQAGEQPLFRSADMFGMTVIARDGEWRKALAIAEQEMRRAEEHGFTASEIAEAKANLATQLANSVQQAQGRQSGAIADAIATSSRADEVYVSPETRLAAYQALEAGITPDAVAGAFRAAWQGGPTAIHVSAKQAVDDPAAQIAAVLGECRQVAVAAPAERQAVAFAYTDFGPAGTVVSDTVADAGIRQVRFANGLQLNLKQTDFEPGRVLYRLDVGQGTSTYPADKPGLAFMTNLLPQIDGFAAHDVDELRRITAGKQVSLAFTGGAGSMVAQGNTTTDDLELQLQLLGARLTAPGWRAETASQWAGAQPVLAKNLGSDPMQIVGLALNYGLTGGDTRMGLDNPAKLSGLTLEDLKAVLAPQLAQGPLSLALVGDFDPAASIAAVAKTLGALPARAARQDGVTAKAAFSADRSTRVIRHAGASDQGVVALSWPTTDNSDLRSVQERELLSAVLTLRLIDEIREKLGATYTPQSFSFASPVYAGYGHLTALAPADPKQMDLVTSTIRTIAAGLAASPPSEDELVRARGPLLERYQRDERANASWAASVARAQSDPEVLADFTGRAAALRAIDGAAVQAAARKWFSEMPIETRIVPAEG
ncbi:M16 family metallopeptidase [Tsuneonella sp. HG222]